LRKEKKEHPHLGATYEIMEKDRAFVVQVKIPGAHPALINFTAREDAERWIERHKTGVAQGLPQRMRFNTRPKA
jgi:hypothetical protein